jgi:hypothetical protein
MYFTNVPGGTKHDVYIGRWVFLTKRHQLMFEAGMEKTGNAICILVRDTKFDSVPAKTRADIIKQYMLNNEVQGSIIIIPDIECVFYGRAVGYKVEELELPEDETFISRSMITDKIRNGEEWEEYVADGTYQTIDAIKELFIL